MRVHHLNCGCMCPWGGPIWDGVSRGPTGRLICHCLLVEADDGLVLVDTGFGTGDMERPYQRLSPLFIHLNRIQFERRYTALEQVRSLGFSPRDVRHIVLTHLDFDHAGGLDDFPDATVHVMRAEMDQAEDRDGFIARNRYRPQQWDRVRNWRFYDVSRGERWFGFEAVRNLDGLPPEILMIPLPGHTWGHCGIAIDTPDGWLLDAADTYFYRREIDRPERQAPVGPRAYQRLMATDYELHLHNQERLREVYGERRGVLTVFCTHDAVEFDALAQRSSTPAQAWARRSEPSPAERATAST
jgi:glyoxylase-like metal-dependent hydrolase (beta-lactamase superfamily II)